MLRIFLALWIAIAPALAWAGQSGLLLGVSSAGTPFSLTEISTNSSTTAGTSFSFSAQNIGTADPTRIVAVAISYQPSGAGNVVSTVTIGGSTATQGTSCAVSETGGPSNDLWYLAVPTGTTATIGITATNTFSRIAIAVYSVVGTGAAFNNCATTSSATSVTTLATSATIPAGGGAIGFSHLHSATPGTVTPTNLITDVNAVFGTSTQLAGHNVTSSGSTSMGFSWTSATDGVLTLATFSP